MELLCPICQSRLIRRENSLICDSNHCFDYARQGYVNLLPVNQKHSIQPGDTAEMVAARKAFLDTGTYFPIVEKLTSLYSEFVPLRSSVLDVGCGEGYYLSHIDAPERWGIDISKHAVRYASSRDKSANWITATASHLPFNNDSFDCLISMFALTVADEFARVLKANGIYIQVIAGENHLMSLKKIIYPQILHKDKILHNDYPGFSLIRSERLSFKIQLSSNTMIHNLLYMTPHVHRISRDGIEALNDTYFLEDETDVIFNIYSRQ